MRGRIFVCVLAAGMLIPPSGWSTASGAQANDPLVGVWRCVSAVEVVDGQESDLSCGGLTRVVPTSTGFKGVVVRTDNPCRHVGEETWSITGKNGLRYTGTNSWYYEADCAPRGRGETEWNLSPSGANLRMCSHDPESEEVECLDYVAGVEPIVLTRSGAVRTLVEDRNPKASLTHEYRLVTPHRERVCGGCDSGDVADLGIFDEETELVFELRAYDEDGDYGTYRSDDPAHADVKRIGASRWRIHWEDATDGNFIDLVTKVWLLSEPSYWNARPRSVAIALPDLPRFEGLGTIVAAGFIPEEETPVFPKSLAGGAGPRIFRGDGRGFSKDGLINPNSNRFFIELDFPARRAFIQVTPTCRIPGSGHGGTCHQPYEIVYDDPPEFGLRDTARQGRRYKKNYIVVGVSDDGGELGLTWSIAQSAEGWRWQKKPMDLLRPRADGQMVIEADEGPSWELSYRGDCFPSLEVVRSLDGDRETLGRIRDRGASSMFNVFSNIRHAFGAYC